MKPLSPQRVLAIALNTRGFGFAILEGANNLIDWGVKTMRKDKRAGCLAKVAELISLFEPDGIALEDMSWPGCQRGGPARKLNLHVATMGGTGGIDVRMISREMINDLYFDGKHGTKHELAHLLAKRFPAELASRIPPKRKPWMSEDYRMGMFDALAIALAAITN